MSSTNPLTSRFIAFRAKRKLANGGTITLEAIATIEQMDARAAKVIASNLIKERRAAMNDDISNTGDEIRAEVSQLENDVAPVSGFSLAGDYMLTPAERAQLAKEYAPRRAVAPSVISTQDNDDALSPDFTPSPVESYSSLIDGAMDAEVAEFARFAADFEIMVEREASKLLLMA